MHKTTIPTRKTEVFQFRLSAHDKAVMEKVAEAKGISLAGFLRAHGLAAVKSEGDLMAS